MFVIMYLLTLHTYIHINIYMYICINTGETCRITNSTSYAEAWKKTISHIYIYIYSNISIYLPEYAHIFLCIYINNNTGETCRITNSTSYAEAWKKTVSPGTEWIIQAVNEYVYMYMCMCNTCIYMHMCMYLYTHINVCIYVFEYIYVSPGTEWIIQAIYMNISEFIYVYS
jgi:hypothetical protein